MNYNEVVFINNQKNKNLVGSFNAMLELSPLALSLYIRLVNNDKEFKPTIAWVQKIMQVSNGKAQALTKELEEKGYLQKDYVSYNVWRWTIFYDSKHQGVEFVKKPTKYDQKKIKENKGKQIKADFGSIKNMKSQLLELEKMYEVYEKYGTKYEKEMLELKEKIEKLEKAITIGEIFND